MKITNILEGDSAISVMNRNSPAAFRMSNRHSAKKDRFWRLTIRKQRKRRVALRKEWRHFSKKDLLPRLAVRTEQKLKNSHVALRKERKRKYILATTKEDMFANLPEDITKDILCRLPISSVMTCKCVLKSWRHLIEGDEFGMSYTPKPGLTFIYRDMEMRYSVFNEAFKPLFQFSLPSHNQRSTTKRRVVITSANGLLSLWDQFANFLFICNPLTREYAELPRLKAGRVTTFYGFGMSKIRGQYKILYGNEFGCHVYTIGRGVGLWRSIAAPQPGINTLYYDYAAFFNGNLHWLACDSKGNFFVCYFDFDTELFSRFSIPCDYDGNSYGNNRLYMLDGWLYLCNIIDWHRVIIWKMNNYGDENSWIKEYDFNLPKEIPHTYLLKVLANGDLLFAISVVGYVNPDRDELFIYSKKTGALGKYVTCYSFEQCSSSSIGVFTPSLISLKTMGFHNVQSVSF